MFGDIFDTEQEILTGVKEGQVQSSWERLPRCCADQLKIPDVERKKGYPIGLKNIGQTCYLNSLLQILFHTPQLRKVILQLPLCKDTIQNKSDFFDHASKHKFMMGFQRLFSEMSNKDAKSLTTEYLKDAFGWQGSEHVQQHDIEEAMKIIFDTFQRALHGTQYEKIIKQLFRGISSQYKSCRNCTVTSQKLDDFYGLTVPVKNLNNLSQSMLSFLTAQAMQGDNKIYCQTCESKQDMWLGSKLKVLPEILMFTLRRFTFDYEVLDRVKINDFFSFDLQYDLSHLLEDVDTSVQYQLYGVMVHRGSAHGGHYFCYIRDVMQQSDWHKSLKQAKQQQQKLDQWKKKQTEVTEQQKKRRQQKDKQNQIYDLKQPNNLKLLQNWFCLDDSICQGIDAKKLTTKFQGSQSAYILFYRKKNLQPPSQIKVPEYFSKIIEQQNDFLRKERQYYQEKKKQIILKINGVDELINLQMKIQDFMDVYCPMGCSLVNQAKNNDLPYYPMEINSLQDRDAQQILSTLQLIHESTWKKYQIDSPQYQQIRPVINKDKIPFQLNVLFASSSSKIVLYQDQTLSQLKYKITQKFNIPYQKQVIKLVSPYKQYFVTDDLKNDDVLLTKLGFVHECQIILKKLQTQQQRTQDVKKQIVEDQATMYCFVVERDDVHGIKRMYFQKNKTLRDLFEHIIKYQAIPNDGNRRLRNLNGDRLFYTEQYDNILQQMKFNEQIIKLRIERGQIPIKGDICIMAKIQSKFKQQQCPQQFQIIFDPNISINDMKKQLCEKTGLDHEKHKIYLTDWMGEPVRPVNRQKLSLFDTGFGRQQTICLRDIESPIGSELFYLQVYQTIIGTPEDVSSKFPIKLEQTKTLLDLKNMILQSQLCRDIPDLNHKRIRVRQLKRDYMLGNILRNSKSQMKSLGLNSNKIVVQILDFEEQLTDNQIVVILKKRNPQKRLYENNIQLVFDAGKNPSIESLMQAVRQKLQIKQGQQIKIVKYIHYNFEWMQICEKSIDKFLKGKSKNEGGKKKNKGEKKQEGKIGQQDKKGEQSKQKVQSQRKQIKSQEVKQKPVENRNQKKQGKKNKGGNQPTKDKEQLRRQQCLNLRKAPFLLKDGDWIGYGFIQELKNDDLQTDQDLTLRHLKKNQKNLGKGFRNKGQQKGFRVNLDF